MTAQTGRTIQRWIGFLLSDGTALRSLEVDTINNIGLNYPEVEVYAWLDLIKGVLLDTPDCAIDIGGPFSNIANGAHVVLSAQNGLYTPRSFDIQIGIQHAWEAGEPQFGITATATSGILVSNYIVTGNKYSAKLRMKTGSSAPVWGTAAETVS
jgi:hypothetical protein